MPSGKKTKKKRRAEQSADNQRSSVSDIRQPYFFSRYTLLSLALIIVIGLLVYANTFNAPFVYDDKTNILNSPFIRLNHISVNGLKNILKNQSTFRPLANLTFAVNYYFHQYDVTGYHIVNVIIHLINGFLVFFLTRQTLLLCRMENTWIALPAALLWLVNPVHTQSVTYIVQRMNSLATMFYLLAMVCYIQGRLIQRRVNRPALSPAIFFTAAALAGLSALASKQITATLPVIIFLYEWYFFQNLNRDWFKKQARRIIVMVIVLIIVALIYLKGDPLAELASKYARKDITLSQRLLTEPGVVLYYLSLLLYPSPDRLRIIYQISPATSLFPPANTLLPLIALAGLITIFLRLRHKNRLISFAVVWYLINLIIESSFIPVALAFEHRTYLPSVFPFIATACLLFRRTRPQKAIGIISAAVIICGFWTWQRNAVWTDKVTFWNDAVMKAPNDQGALNNLGMAYNEQGELETALTYFKTALEKDENYEKTYNNIGSTLIELNRPAEAVHYLEIAVSLKADSDSAYHNLGVALNDLGQTEKAESSYARSLELNPLCELVHNKTGIIKMNRGKFDEAMAHFKRALSLNPYYEPAYINMGIACFRKGKPDRALTYFKKAIAINPASAEAAKNFNDVTRVMKQYGPAIARLQQARQQRPNDPEITFQLAVLCQQASIVDLAADLYEQTLSLDPRCEKCLNALAGLYLTAGRYKQAAQMLEQLALLYPDESSIFYGLARAYAQDNQKAQAVENLRKAVAKGFDDINHIRSDNTLKAIRDTDYFRNLTAGGKD